MNIRGISIFAHSECGYFLTLILGKWVGDFQHVHQREFIKHA